MKGTSDEHKRLHKALENSGMVLVSQISSKNIEASEVRHLQHASPHSYSL